MTASVRVVTLLPSATETLLAWGIEPVACTRFCEQPSLRHVGGTKDPDVEAIVSLRPDLVVMDEEENRKEDAEALRAAGVDVFVTAVRSVADVDPTLARLADRLEHSDRSVRVSEPLRYENPHRTKRRGFVPIWRRPWMTINGDTYGSSVLDAIGIVNVFATEASRYPEVTLDEAAARQPEMVVAPSEPYPFTPGRNEDELAVVAPVTFVDGRDLFWWGVRTASALGRLRAALAG